MITFTAKNIVQQGNSLSLELHFADSDTPNSSYRNNYVPSTNTQTTQEYLINGRVVFQAKVTKFYQTLLYFVKFTKVHETDKLAYAIKYSSMIKLNNNDNKREMYFTVENDCWYVIDELKLDKCTWSVVINLITPALVNPCATMYDDDELTDIKFTAVDGSVHLHRVIAAAFSPVIRTGLTGEWGKLAKPEIKAPCGTTEATLLHLKTYMYKGTLPEDGLKELLVLASFYMMPDLERRSVQKFLTELSSEQAYDLLEFAMKHQNKQLVFGLMSHTQNGLLDVEEIQKHQKWV